MLDHKSIGNHPQTSFETTSFDKDSFLGKLRSLYASTVLDTQLAQMKKQGSYEAFNLKHHPAYDVRPLKGARSRQDGIPPSLFWESDVGKWIEAASYFLASDDAIDQSKAQEYRDAMDHMIDLIEKAQQPDGYLNIYFTVVDKDGKFKNLRDMHEMYNAGHLLEASMAHYRYTGSRKFLDVMIKNMDCFIAHFGPGPDQKHGYPGHPELELAVLRLYSLTRDPKHLQFGTYLLQARGVQRQDQNGMSYFAYEAKSRPGECLPMTMEPQWPERYNQSHAPLHEQDAIYGHSVRAFYLTTAAADLGGEFMNDAKRLYDNAVDAKMYVTGGFGSEPRWEGFSNYDHHLPQSIKEGGCYAETCASIAAMMTSERLLAHKLDGKVRDTMELCLYNAVLGGGDLHGKAFSYENSLTTYGEESAKRKDWFEVCCCPPNLSRTLGMLGGYVWTIDVDESAKKIKTIVYLFGSCTRKIELPGGESASITMSSGMPWKGETSWDVEAPEGWSWELVVPMPEYAKNIELSPESSDGQDGFASIELKNASKASSRFDLPIRLLSSHPRTGQDTLTVTRGPIVFVAEDLDNDEVESKYEHFEGVGIARDAVLEEKPLSIEGHEVITIVATKGVCGYTTGDRPLWQAIEPDTRSREWKVIPEGLTLVPWFARANRGGRGHIRTSFERVRD